MYIDSHAHVEGSKFDPDRAEMLSRAREAGLERILAIGSGTGPGTYDCALKTAEQHDWIFASTGLLRRAGASGIGDPRAVPLLLALVAIGTLLASPIENTMSRAVEGRSCMSPCAPALETTRGSKSDSVLMTARMNASGMP